MATAQYVGSRGVQDAEGSTGRGELQAGTCADLDGAVIGQSVDNEWTMSGQWVDKQVDVWVCGWVGIQV